MNGMSCLSLVGMFVAIMAIPIIGIIVIPIQEYAGKPKDEQNDYNDTYWRMMGLRPPEKENYWNVANNYSPNTDNQPYKKVIKYSTKTTYNSTEKQDVISIVKTPNGLEYYINVGGSLPSGISKKEVTINY